jgi:hypothetical protein
MIRSAQAVRRRVSASSMQLAGIRTHMAQAMIGHTVKLLVNAHTVARGIVTGVAVGSAGTPKLVVGGARYDISQVLTATPAYLK